MTFQFGQVCGLAAQADSEAELPTNHTTVMNDFPLMRELNLAVSKPDTYDISRRHLAPQA
eukprot:6491936-Amphidinium_carterae.2